MNSLIKKYNVQAPRYTSYPTVPYWDQTIDFSTFESFIQKAFNESNQTQGISLYIHLPYCESLCTYCGCNTKITKNHAVETPYIQAILKEWHMYLRLFGTTPKIKEIHLGGGTPTFFSPVHLKQLLSGILSTQHSTSPVDLGFEAHPANTTQAHLETLYQQGARRLSLGIQDFDLRVQHIVNRHQSYEQVEQLTHAARTLGYQSINYDLIYGLPLQTQASVTKTIEQVISLKPDRIAFYSYAHVPWIKPGQRLFTEADLPADEEKLKLYEIGRTLFLQAGYHEIGMDHFALEKDDLYQSHIKKTLHRNFMGYTPNYTQLMIGLGASSIGDSWYTYAQNHKKVGDYLAAIEQNRWPIFRGHVLTTEDLILRRHILDLMCRMFTDWQDQKSQCDAVTDALVQLKELEQDGLVKLSKQSISVTSLGKTFLRNICMTLDARLKRKLPNTQVFSRVA